MVAAMLRFLLLSFIFTSFLMKCDANPRSVGSRIAGGTEAARNQFPFQVYIFIALLNGRDTICSGSILSQNYVLSAAHCFQNFEVAEIFGGIHDIDLDDPEYYLRFRPAEVKIHEQYNIVNFFNDIAIVNVAKKPIVFSTKLQSIKLAPRALVDVDLTSQVGRLAGWGAYNDAGIPSSRLLFIDNPIISKAECTRYFGDDFTDSNICMSGLSGRSACPGDSGGPLTIDQNGSRVQVGIVSFGSQSSCTFGYPVAFTKVSSYLNWIQSNSDFVVV